MRAATVTWLEGLRDFAAARRLDHPAAAPGPDAAAWSAERSIIGASLALRLAELDAVRQARRELASVDPDPVIVLTTSPAGMAAVTSLLAGSTGLALIADSRIISVSESEYRLWCIEHPDDAHRLHVNLWSWVKTRVPRQRWSEFAAHPIRDGEAYWLHREGLAGAGSLDRRASHLWRWDGSHASLLQAFVVERAAPRLGDHRG